MVSSTGGIWVKALQVSSFRKMALPATLLFGLEETQHTLNAADHFVEKFVHQVGLFHLGDIGHYPRRKGKRKSLYLNNKYTGYGQARSQNRSF